MLIYFQGKCLCGHYIRSKLRRAGVLNRKVTQRLRNIIDTPSSSVVREIFPTINALGSELERLHSRTYTNISRQLTRNTFGEELHEILLLLNAVAKDLFKSDITWGKIISLFAINGGLAVDSIRQGNYDYLGPLVEATGEIIEEYLGAFLTENGGWVRINFMQLIDGIWYIYISVRTARIHSTRH